MELLDLYNDDGEKLQETIVRWEKPPKGKNIMLSVIFIRNREGNYLIQKSSKEKGGYYSSTGGHVTHGENGLDTIERELEEELGITNIENEIHYIKTFKYPTKECIFNVYLLEVEQLDLSKLKLQKQEVEEVKFLTCKEIEILKEKGEFLESHAYIFEKILNYKGNGL